MEIRLIPLSWHNLEIAKTLLREIFYYENQDTVELVRDEVYPQSIAKGKFILRIGTVQETCLWCKYYVATNELNEFVGLTGMFCESEETSTVAYLGWFGIRKKFRSHGYGKATIEKTIELAQQQGITTMKFGHQMFQKKKEQTNSI